MLTMITVMILIGVAAVRVAQRNSLVCEYRYQLFELRDRLRQLAIRDEPASRSWLFAYFDSTTAKAVGLLPDLTVWQLLALENVYKNDPRFKLLSKNLDIELAKPQHREFKAFEEELIKTLGAYLFERHRTLLMTVEVADHLSAGIRQTIQETKRKSLEVAIKSPETSTLGDFAPCPA
jgi:hypothetical protein